MAKKFVLSRNYFTNFNPILVRKLTNKRVRWIIKQLNRGTPIKEIAAVMRVTPRRIYQIQRQYRETNVIPILKQARRKLKPIDPKTQEPTP